MAGEFCPRCGAARTGAFKFCRGCGFDFEGGVGFAAMKPPPIPAASSAALLPAPPLKAKAQTGRVTLVGLLGAVGFGLWLFSRVYSSGTGVSLPLVTDTTAGWHTNLAQTTCGDFTGSMTSAQQIAAAASMLSIFRETEVSDASDGAEFASPFAAQVGAACAKYYGSDPSTGVIAGATMAYMDNPSLHPAHH
jgi:hypothetical protein